MVADARGLCDPYKQILFVVVANLLPHLEKAMHGIAGKIAISHVARELERAVAQIIGKARVGYIAGLPRGIGCVGLRQLGVGTGAHWIEAVGTLRVGVPLLGIDEIAAGFALRVDDILRQKVHYGLPGRGV